MWAKDLSLEQDLNEGLEDEPPPDGTLNREDMREKKSKKEKGGKIQL